MKITLIAAAAALMMTAAQARAESEGNGDPFPFHADGVTTLIRPAPAAALAERDAPARRPIARVAPNTIFMAHPAGMGRG